MTRALENTDDLNDLVLSAEGVTRARSLGKGVQEFRMVNPLERSFSSYTPYHYVHNNPINLIDPTGMSADTAWVPTRDWNENDADNYAAFVNAEVKSMQDSGEESDCADLACSLFIRYASSEGLEVEFTTTTGGTLNSTTDSSTNPEDFERKVNNSTTASTLDANDLVSAGSSPQAGDLHADDVHVNVVVNQRASTSRGRTSTVSGSIPARVPEPSSVGSYNTFRSFKPIGRSRQKAWHSQKRATRRREMLGPL